METRSPTADEQGHISVRDIAEVILPALQRISCWPPYPGRQGMQTFTETPQRRGSEASDEDEGSHSRNSVSLEQLNERLNGIPNIFVRQSPK
jgi:hypothetical protein